MAEILKNKKSNSRMTRDWTQGFVIRNLLMLSWPMIAMEFTYMVSQIFDTALVGKSGSTSIAAIGVSSSIMMVIMVFDMALMSGGRAMISRFIGANDDEMAHKAAGQVYLLAIIWGSIVTIAGFFFAEKFLLILFNLTPDVLSEGTKYIRVVFSGWIFMEILIMSLYIMQSTGDSVNPMILEIIMRVIHVSLSFVFILGLWIFPAMGVVGAALSNIISQAIGAAIGLFLVFSGRTRLKMKLRDFKFIPNISWRILKIGIPSMVSMTQMSIAGLFIMKLTTSFGTAAIAANQIVGTVMGIVQSVSMGMGSGISVLVGQNLGAKKIEQAVKTVWKGGGILQLFCLLFGLVILIWAEKLIVLFSPDPSLVEIGSTFLRISTVGLLVSGFGTAFNNCLSGAGATFPNMVINIACTWAIQIPLAFFLSKSFGLEANGIRWAMTISTIISALATFAYFQTGRWKRKNV